MLPTSQHDQYRRDGFVLLPQLLDPRLIANCSGEIEAVFRRQAAKMNRPVDASATLADAILAVLVPGTRERSFVYNLVRHIHTGRLIQTSPVIYAVLRQMGLEMPICLETPTIRFDLPGEREFLTGPHQDVNSIYCSRCITVWVPLVPCNTVTGTVGIYPGSHRRGLLPHGTDPAKRGFSRYRVEEQDDTFGELQIVEAEPGDVLFFDALCVHRSYPGTRDVVKIVTTFSYNDAHAMQLDDPLAAMKLA